MSAHINILHPKLLKQSTWFDQSIAKPKNKSLKFCKCCITAGKKHEIDIYQQQKCSSAKEWTRAYSKRAVQPICAVQDAICAVQNENLCSPKTQSAVEMLLWRCYYLEMSKNTKWMMWWKHNPIKQPWCTVVVVVVE